MNPFEEKPVLKSHSSNSARKSYWQSFNQGGYYHTPPIPATTQKARGIFFIMNKSAVIKTAFAWRVPKHILFKAGETFSDNSFNFPVFVRPCPVDPRHGFVDSTSCKTAAEVNALSKETFEEEEDAEVLVTKPIDASYSAILTDGVLTFSGGNDGATSGRNIKYFYLNEDPIATTISLDQDVLLEGEVPFYEFVLDKQGNVNLVQVRSAPGVPKCKDYIPEQVEVKTILKAEGDLLDWEKLLKEVDPRTTIIDHTNGSLASHYAIHAIINRVPIFTSYLPKVGDVVEATVLDTEINDDDRDKFYKAFCYGFTAGEYMLKNAMFEQQGNATQLMTNSLYLALSVLHNFSAIAMAKDYEVVGITLGLFLRATFSVSAGESRYVGSRLNNSHAADLRNWKSNIPGGRYEVYNWMYKKDTSEFIDNIMIIYRIFKEVKWGGSFGGPKWQSCTRSSIDLFNACVNRDIKSVVELFNQVLHEQHNGGLYLNKIIQVSQFDQAANNPSLYGLKNLKTIIDLLSTVWGFAGSIDENQIPWEKFTPINYKSYTKASTGPSKGQPVGRWSIHTAKAFVNGTGKVSKIYLESDSFPNGKLTMAIEGPNVGTKTNICECGDEGCPESTVVPAAPHNEWSSLGSIPYYWTLESVKVATKSSINSMIDKAIKPNQKKKTIPTFKPKKAVKKQQVYGVSGSKVAKVAEAEKMLTELKKLAEIAKKNSDAVAPSGLMKALLTGEGEM